MRKSLAALAAISGLALGSISFGTGLVRRESYNRPRSQRNRRFRRYDDQLRGFPGAKLMRKARDGKLGLSTIR